MKPTLDKDGFYESGNGYWTLKDDCEIRITNFNIEPLNKYSIEGKKYYVCFLRSDSDERKVIAIPDNEMNSIKKFNKKIEEYGNFNFIGDEKDFQQFWKWLVAEFWKIKDNGVYQKIDLGDEAITTVRSALKEGRVRCVSWLEPFCIFDVRQKNGETRYRLYRLKYCDAIAAMRQIPIVPFRFIIEENKYAEDWTYDPKKGGAA